MNNLLLSGNFSKEIFNFTQKFNIGFSKPQQSNFRKLMKGLIGSGSTYLTDIIKANGFDGLLRKNVEKFSNTLSKFNLPFMTKKHVDSKVLKYKNEPVLILSDGGDIQKPHAKKMEGVCGNVDGSKNHSGGKGYYAHALVAYGVSSKKLSPLALSVFSTQSEDYKSILTEEQKNFSLLRKFIDSSTQDRIIVEDRGCDDERRFRHFVYDLKCSFVTRVHTGGKSRKILTRNIDGSYDELSINDLSKELKNVASEPRDWYNKKLKKKLTSKIVYRKVFLRNMISVPLTLIFCYTDPFKEPLVLLTDLSPENLNEAWDYFFYYKKRWEVENFYRGIKQRFHAEQFTIQKLKKIQALMFTVMIAYDFVIEMKQKSEELLDGIHFLFLNYCKNFQKKKDHHLSFLSFLRDNFVFIRTRNTQQFCADVTLDYGCRKTILQPSLLKHLKKW